MTRLSASVRVPPQRLSARDAAAEALRLASVSPGQAETVGREAEQAAVAEDDWAAASVARRARGVAAMQLRLLEASTDHLHGAIEAARRANRRELEGEAHMSLASVLVLRGRTDRAFRALEVALDRLSGVSAARALTQRSAILQELGRVDEALDDLRQALPVLRRAGDVQWETRALSNRSLLLTKRRLFSLAEADLLRARELCLRHDLTLAGAYAEQNLGCVHAGRGDVPAALEHFDAAAERYRALGLHVGSLLVDRAGALLSVRLVSEARATAEAAVAAYAAQGREVHLPEAQLLLSTTALLDDDLTTAVRAASQAAQGFARLGRTHDVALAAWAQVQAEIAAAQSTGAAEGLAALAERARASATDLAAAGWTIPALEARVLAGRLALEDGQMEQARADLAQAARGRRSGPADARARAWLADALLREADGRRRAARSALRTGLRIVEEYQASLGATELRAHVSVHRGALARAGLRMALQDSDARAVLWWAERGRATALRMRPVRPPDDPSLAHDLQDLRATMAEIEQARSLDGATGPLVARQVQLERRIRDHCRRLPGNGRQASGTSCAAAPPPVAELSAALGAAALVEFLELDEELHAVTLVAGRARLHSLGPSRTVRHCLKHLPFALHRLAHPTTSATQLTAATRVLDHAAAVLDGALLEPLSPLLRDRPLVVVPTGWLQSLPWSLLPTCAGRPVSVAPSAALWHAAQRRDPPAEGDVVVVAGPGLPGALSEARAVAAMHPGAHLLHGDGATASAVGDAMARAATAHIAAHGLVRSDNPLFSALLLADGPFTVYDLERLAGPTHHVVLAACDTARPHVTAGEEILGLAAALLGQGTATLVAPVVSVPDAETAPLMLSYHRQLLAGEPPATALALAQQEHAGESPRARASAISFVCLGAGHTARSPQAALSC